MRQRLNLRQTTLSRTLSAGRVFEAQNKLDDAAREYQIAAKLDPKSAEPITGLANVYSKQKKYPEAEAELRKLVALEPGNNAAQLQLGRVLAAEGKSEEAAKIPDSEQTASPNDPRAALDLGEVLAKAGKYAEAEEQLRAGRAGPAPGCGSPLCAGLGTDGGEAVSRVRKRSCCWRPSSNPTWPKSTATWRPSPPRTRTTIWRFVRWISAPSFFRRLQRHTSCAPRRTIT